MFVPHFSYTSYSTRCRASIDSFPNDSDLNSFTLKLSDSNERVVAGQDISTFSSIIQLKFERTPQVGQAEIQLRDSKAVKVSIV
jgi:hypothetical protein